MKNKTNILQTLKFVEYSSTGKPIFYHRLFKKYYVLLDNVFYEI